MSEKVTREGIVLRKKQRGEANVRIALLTEEGLIFATARSSRREASKLRYGLEPFTCGRFTLVRGAYEWKLVGTHNLSRNLLLGKLFSRAAAGRIARLLMRLIKGEERAPHLFHTIAEGFSLLSFAQTREEVEGIECVLVLRTLFSLGYLPKTPELAPFLGEERTSLKDAAHNAINRSLLIRAINESLQTSGL